MRLSWTGQVDLEEPTRNGLLYATESLLYFLRSAGELRTLPRGHALD